MNVSNANVCKIRFVAKVTVGGVPFHPGDEVDTLTLRQMERLIGSGYAEMVSGEVEGVGTAAPEVNPTEDGADAQEVATTGDDSDTGKPDGTEDEHQQHAEQVAPVPDPADGSAEEAGANARKSGKAGATRRSRSG